MSGKIPGVGEDTLLGGRDGVGEERGEDGREEGDVSPLEALRVLPPVAGDRVPCPLWRFEALLSK